METKLKGRDRDSKGTGKRDHPFYYGLDNEFITWEYISPSSVGTVKCVKNNIGDEVIKEEEVKERNDQIDYWLCEGIVVKVMSKDLADKGYYEKIGVVRKVIDKYDRAPTW
uniref:KIN17-like protein n=1 Tax=Tanacetum cinerariifolium TaxID=118510 RepID=A0A6L2NSR5_TANCI|nr:KIN17-like protein [Tanacetum cinerariifolium]